MGIELRGNKGWGGDCGREKGEVGRGKRERNRGERGKTVGGREKYWTVLYRKTRNYPQLIFSSSI